MLRTIALLAFASPSVALADEFARLTPSDSIQAAIDGATTDLAVYLEPGTYSECLSVSDSAMVKVIALSGAVILDCAGAQPYAVTVDNASLKMGGGIEIRNFGESGIRVQNAGSVIADNLVASGRNFGNNGLIRAADGASLFLYDVSIDGLQGGTLEATHLQVSSCTAANGAGLNSTSDNVTIENSVFESNQATSEGGGARLLTTPLASIRV